MSKGLQRGELGEVGVPDIAAEGEVGAAAFASDFDQAGLAELLHVVRDGGRAESFFCLEGAARGGVVAAGDLLQDGVAVGVGEGAGDLLGLGGGEAGFDGSGHGARFC
jgi:hypothetical protein